MTDAGFSLVGRRALVTGASTGIGAAIAERLHGAGAEVVGVSRRGASTAPGIAAIAADLSDLSDLDTVVARAVDVLGGLDILVNNAGTADWRPSGEFERADFDATMHLNVWAPLRLCQLARSHLSASGAGVVVNIGSVDAHRPSPGAALYGASKAALSALTTVLAKEWAAEGIRVVQVDPGLVDTPLAAAAVQSARASPQPINLQDRVGEPAEIAGLVQYLVSPLGRFANATNYRLDGGALAMGPFDQL